MPWRARGVRSVLLHRRASRPQLKRDPLGGCTYSDRPSAIMTTPPKSMREDFVRGLKIVAGTFATSVPAYFLAQLLFTRELAMAVGFAAALGTSSALQAQTRPGGAFGWRRHLLLGVIVTACLTPLLWLLFRSSAR